MANAEQRDNKHGKFEIFSRLTRIQFIPLVVLPALIGASFAYSTLHSLNYPYLGLTLLGVILIHLGANAIDDCYDFQNGVDAVANSMFPPDFGGWKPLPRGLISLERAKLISYSLFGGALVVATLLGILVGIWAFVLGFIGVVLSVIYTAPPLKLDYRGFGLGELSIFFAFGPIAALGSYFVQTAQLNFNVFLISVPIGIMTVTILMNHDMIFFEVYRRASKFSLATVLGKKVALFTSLALSLVAYVMVIALVMIKVLPVWSFAAPVISLLVLLRKAPTYAKPNEPPPSYVQLTVNGLFANWLFGLALVSSILL